MRPRHILTTVVGTVTITTTIERAVRDADMYRMVVRTAYDGYPHGHTPHRGATMMVRSPSMADTIVIGIETARLRLATQHDEAVSAWRAAYAEFDARVALDQAIERDVYVDDE